MAQVLEGIKTFFIMMTENGDVEYISDKMAEEEAKKITAKYNKDLEAKAEEVRNNSAIPQKDEKTSFISKQHVSERKADEVAKQVAQEKEKQSEQVREK